MYYYSLWSKMFIQLVAASKFHQREATEVIKRLKIHSYEIIIQYSSIYIFFPSLNTFALPSREVFHFKAYFKARPNKEKTKDFISC